MAAAASWSYRGHPLEAQSAPLVQFSNGKLQNSENMDFTLYKNNDATNPRKKHQRILTAETDRLSYVGKNFGAGVLKCNSLCRFFVGVLDKDSRQMEVYNAELFNMQPLLSDDLREEDPSDNQPKSYREKVDSCIAAFGTSKQKRALSSRRMNEVGSETLNVAVTKAAANIIAAKGVAALLSDAAQDDLQDVSLVLPPCHEEADKAEDVYRFEDILSPAEYEALQSPAAALLSLSPEELLQKAEEKSHCSFVLEALKFMPRKEDSADHKARCLWFLDALVKFSLQTVIKKKHTMGPDCPPVISRKLMNQFTAQTYNHGRLQNLISASMRAKITAYVLALTLHVNNFQADLTVLQRDMKLHENKVLGIARAMRLKVSKRKGPADLLAEEEHKLATLSLPLPVYRPPGGKRRKMK
ncbi:DNA-directed RNA polymerase I subunit RPA49 isoform X1 [Pelodiscus sinensis]|uniref:DNA-directed RNA polymerase I subunit RPA49 isoform X1 n=1 Tax=Pelodiscus sinensis TaxID=13735 RepID=UPI003F6D7E56